MQFGGQGRPFLGIRVFHQQQFVRTLAHHHPLAGTQRRAHLPVADQRRSRIDRAAVIITVLLKAITTGRNDKLCGQIGVMHRAWTLGLMIGPPEATL